MPPSELVALKTSIPRAPRGRAAVVFTVGDGETSISKSAKGRHPANGATALERLTGYCRGVEEPSVRALELNQVGPPGLQLS